MSTKIATKKDRIFSKTIARKLHGKGHLILIMPCKIPLDCNWYYGHLLHKRSEFDFDIFVSDIEYADCNAENGYYCKYYDLGFEEDER